MAWFQLDSQAPQTNLVSGSADIDIQNITGYKINPQLNSKGGIDYNNTTVTSKNANSSDYTNTTNEDQEGADTDFDVPTSGIGYYLIPAINNQYKYSNAGVVKFTEYAECDRIYAKYTFTADQVVRIKKYTFEHNQTVNTRITISSVSPSQSGEKTTGNDLKVLIAGTYIVWYDISDSTIRLERTSSAAKSKMPKKNKIDVSGGDNRQNVLVTLDVSTTNAFSTDSVTNVYFAIVDDNGDATYGWKTATASSTYGGNYYYVFTGVTSTKTTLYCYFTTTNNGNTRYWHPYNTNADSASHYWDTSWSQLTKVSSVSAGNAYKITRYDWSNDDWHHKHDDYSHFWWHYEVSTEELTYTESASALTNNYYLVDYGKFGGGNTMYADAYDSNKTYIGYVYSMSKISNDVYSYYSVAASQSYNTIKFRDTNTISDSGKYTAGLSTSSNSGKYYAFTGEGASNYSGNWYSNKPSSEYITIYLYAPGWNGATKYCYAYYDSGTSYFPNGPYPGVEMTYVRDNYYSVKVSTTYQYVVFSDSNSNKYPSSGGVSLTTPKAGDNKAYNMSNKTWYDPDDYTGDGTKYYVYDPNGFLGTSTPKAFIWGSSKYSTVPAYPGDSTDSEATYDGLTPEVGRLYSITIDSSFTSVVFNADSSSPGTIKTVDLSLSGNGGKVFIILNKNNSNYFTGIWTDSVDYFYVDLSGSGWSNAKVQDTGSTIFYDSISAMEIMSGLFKVYFPRKTSNYDAVLYNQANTTGNNNHTKYVQLNINTRASNYLYLGTNYDGYGRDIIWAVSKADSFTSVATATIYKSSDSGAHWDAGTSMQVGDITNSNYFIYEQGLTVTHGDYVKIVVTNSDTSTYPYLRAMTYDYDDMIRGGSPTPFLKNTNGNIEINLNSGETGDNPTGRTCRLNFYVVNTNINSVQQNATIAIAMVPTLGNGFYIMPSTSNQTIEYYSGAELISTSWNNVFGYLGAKKMGSTSNSSASYGGYYISEANTKLFFRSYVDAVDTLYTSFNINSDLRSTVTGTTTTINNKTYGYINFESPGYYDIEISGSTVFVKPFSINNDFFKLNLLDTNQTISNQASISGLNTALVIEVSFKATAVNSFDTSITLNISAPNDLSSYCGVAFFVPTQAAIAADTSHTTYDENGALKNPYNYMKTHYDQNAANLSTGTSITSSTKILANADIDTVYHAYILIDYRYGATFANMSAIPSGTYMFYITTTQDS